MKYLLILFLISYTNSIYPQNESKIFCTKVDEFTDERSQTNNHQTIAYEDGGDMKTEGAILLLFIKEEKGTIQPSALYVKVVGIEGCVDEGSTLNVLFENGEKIELVNWKDFNCDGKNYFTIKTHEDIFKRSNIKGLRYTNKRNYDSMTFKLNMTEDNKSYIRDVLIEIDKINNGETLVPICESK